MFALMSSQAVKMSIQNPVPWECLINMESVTLLKLQQYSVATTQQICSLNGMPDIENQFIFQSLTGFPGEMYVIFDYLEYSPIASENTQEYSFVAVNTDDSNVKYQGMWYSQGFTSENGSSMEYTFNGM